VCREQSISVNNTLSNAIKLDYGFLQGSCIGPFGFKLYTKALTAIARKHNVEIHLYADDTQLYTSFHPSDSKQAMDRLVACIEEIRSWMDDNYLKLNDSKTEFVMLGSRNDLKNVSERKVTVGDAEILPSKSARNIGAYFDWSLDLKKHTNTVLKSCYHHLRSL